MERAVIRVDGYVQGVGFRWWVQGVARELGLVGHAKNLLDGRVEVDAQGPSDALGTLIRRLIEQQALVEETGDMATGTAGRPAKLFRFRRDVLLERAIAGSKLPLSRAL